jgi:hypothetical protein
MGRYALLLSKRLVGVFTLTLNDLALLAAARGEDLCTSRQCLELRIAAVVTFHKNGLQHSFGKGNGPGGAFTDREQGVDTVDGRARKGWLARPLVQAVNHAMVVEIGNEADWAARRIR